MRRGGVTWACFEVLRRTTGDEAARRHGEALLRARSQARRRELVEELYRVLAEDQVPDRPGRREPRAVKRRPKPYPRLMCHRHQYREIQHQSRYRANRGFGRKSHNKSRA